MIFAEEERCQALRGERAESQPLICHGRELDTDLFGVFFLIPRQIPRRRVFRWWLGFSIPASSHT
jgi:hypothetical protein